MIVVRIPPLVSVCEEFVMVFEQCCLMCESCIVQEWAHVGVCVGRPRHNLPVVHVPPSS